MSDDIKKEAASKAKANRAQMDKLKQTAQSAKGPETKATGKAFTYAEIAAFINTSESVDEINEAIGRTENFPIDQQTELKELAMSRIARINPVADPVDEPAVEDDEVKPEQEETLQDVLQEALEETVAVDDLNLVEEPKQTEVIPVKEVRKQLTTKASHTSFFNDIDAFEGAQRIAKSLCFSTLVPQQYQGNDNLPNTMIALEMAQRMNTSPLMVMQNLYIVHGKPGWSAQYVIASINMCKKFSPLRFELSGEVNSDDRTCIAWARELDTGDRLESPPVSIRMAIDEGWYNKNGSKWKTMPEVMLRYRAASFFGKLYAPEIMMGMQTTEELTDIIDLEPGEDGTFKPANPETLDDLNNELLKSKAS